MRYGMTKESVRCSKEAILHTRSSVAYHSITHSFTDFQSCEAQSCVQSNYDLNKHKQDIIIRNNNNNNIIVQDGAA